MRRTVPLVAEACLLAAGAAAQTPPVGAEDAEIVYPAVITPTRLRQSVADVPGSVTVITADTLRRFGVISVPDALRLVPGMAVTRTVGPDYKISYHGTNILFPRRMNVLIDGVSVYSPAFSEVLWSQLPVAIEDIDRIEVSRGPNSASYGPNSMLAVVNIVTKHPKDVERGFGAVTLGSQSLAEGIARVGLSVGPTAISLTADHYQDGGYDFISNDAFGHDSTRMNRLNARSHTDLSETTSLEVQAALVRGTNEVQFGDSFQLSYPDKNIEDVYVGALLTHQLSPTAARRSSGDGWRAEVGDIDSRVVIAWGHGEDPPRIQCVTEGLESLHRSRSARRQATARLEILTGKGTSLLRPCGRWSSGRGRHAHHHGKAQKQCGGLDPGKLGRL
jgi:iron complex outermembrane receptor protein